MEFDCTYFDKAIDRRDTDSVKWDARELMKEGGIPLWIADMDFPCPPAIVEAVIERAKHPVYAYTIPDDGQALVDFLKRRHDINIEPANLLVFPTIVSAIKACVLSFANEGENVLILSPVYGPFYSSILDNKRNLVDIPLIKDESHRYNIDFDAIENSFKNDDVKLFVVCSPHNPVSRLLSQDELRQIAILCNKYNVKLVVDEIHCDFVYPPHKFTSILNITEAPEDTICLYSASKTFNVAGLRQAYAICRDADTLEKIEDMANRVDALSANIFGLVANKAAFSLCDDWLDGLIAYLDNNRKVLAEFLQNELPLATLTPIESTYLAWVNISAYETDNEALRLRCYDKGVCVNPGTIFGEEGGKGYIRINFACPKEQLLEGMRRLKIALTEKE